MFMIDRPVVGASGRQMTKVGLLSDLQPGDLKLARIGQARVAFCIADGTVRAVSARCTHAHAMLAPGRLTADGLIECPLHGGMFSPIDGSVKCEPAKIALTVHEVRVFDGEIFIDPGPDPDPVNKATTVTTPGARPTAAQWGNWK
jgi:3-phenylpropionate/trans-cinnamate dioxygenase ferredoxin component